MKQIIRPVKGTRDFYPEQMAFRQWLYLKIKEVSRRFGYGEYEGPLLESLELYAAKSGEELVKEQSYVFTDRGGSEITLRPELTPTLARMIAQKQRELSKPIRWWSFGPFWRYERPQRGRVREFYQWNIDILGSASIYAEAEIVAILAEFFRSVGLAPDKVRIKVNNRRLMMEKIQSLGAAAGQIESVYRLIDKLDKLSPEAWISYGKETAGLNDSQIGQLQGFLKNNDLWKDSADLVSFFSLVDGLGVRDYVEFNPSIIRGLMYYTGLVFEAWDVAGEFRAILGGGRYDNLLADVGGEPMGGVGFAMGDVVIELLLEQHGLKPKLNTSSARVLVTVFSDELMGASARIASDLRAKNINTELYPESAKLDKQLKYTSNSGIPFVVIIGPEEYSKGKARLKNMITGNQENVDINELSGKLAGF